jgi:hypothetical protein
VSELGALFYADWRTLINDVRRGVRSPRRVTLWTLYGIIIAGILVSRALYRTSSVNRGASSDIARADYLVCALLGALALALAFGFGRVGIFRTRAEARFIVASRIPAPVAIAYLQARGSLGGALRVLSSLLYVGSIFGPRHVKPLAAVADLVLVIALVAAAAAIAAPRWLASRSWAIACTIVGIPLAFAATVPALRDLTRAFPSSSTAAEIRRVLPRLHPGHVLLAPDPLWILAALAVMTAAIVVLAVVGRDAYPELYALSMAGIDRAESLATRLENQKKAAVARPPVAVRLPAPPGVMVIVWKSVVEFRRGHRRISSVALGAAIWAALGFALARFTADDVARLWATLSVVAFLLLLTSVAATAALANEVRRPLFWLSKATLFERLAALLAAAIWRVIVTFEFIAVGFVAGGGVPLGALVIAIVMPAFVAVLTSSGFAVYALVPNTADGAGPGSAMRFIVSLVLVVPVAAIGAVIGVFFGALPSLAAMTLLMLAQAFTLVGVATWRIDGRIDRLGA